MKRKGYIKQNENKNRAERINKRKLDSSVGTSKINQPLPSITKEKEKKSTEIGMRNQIQSWMQKRVKD